MKKGFLNEKIETMSPEQLRPVQEENPPLGFHCAAPMDDIIRIHSSSGTTGVFGLMSNCSPRERSPVTK